MADATSISVSANRDWCGDDGNITISIGLIGVAPVTLRAGTLTPQSALGATFTPASRTVVDDATSIGSFVYNPLGVGEGQANVDVITFTATGLTGTNVGAATLNSIIVQLVSEENVVNGVNRGDGNIGSYLIPADSNVLFGVNYGSPGAPVTGNVTLPPAAGVLNSQSFGSNSSIDGTCTVPNVGQVLAGINYGPDSANLGTLAVPVAANVRLGTTFGAGSSLTGTIEIPPVATVIESESYGAGGNEFTGTVHLPATNQVVLGAAYGPASGSTGVVTVPVVANVRAGTTFGASLGLTGTMTLPTAGQVQTGVTFGAGGNEFTGSYAGGGGGVYPSPSQVLAPIVFGPSSNLTGTLVPTAAPGINGSGILGMP